MIKLMTLAAGLSLSAIAVHAQDARATADSFATEVALANQTITINRTLDQDAVVAPDFAMASMACPPNCNMDASGRDGVATVGEMELIAFIKNEVANGEGLVIDTRIPAWHAQGTIPGAINLPFTAVSPDNTYRDDIFAALGGQQTNGAWDFSNAKQLIMFCNSQWCQQSPNAIADLLEAGYPADKLRFYRRGMQTWQLVGLTVETGEEEQYRLVSANAVASIAGIAPSSSRVDAQ